MSVPARPRRTHVSVSHGTRMVVGFAIPASYSGPLGVPYTYPGKTMYVRVYPSSSPCTTSRSAVWCGALGGSASSAGTSRSDQALEE